MVQGGKDLWSRRARQAVSGVLLGKKWLWDPMVRGRWSLGVKPDLPKASPG